MQPTEGFLEPVPASTNAANQTNTGAMVNRRTVKLEFSDPAHFLREYRSNLSKGGIFVRIDEPFKLREPVDVEVVLGFQGESIVISGEVVGVVSKALSASGEPGIAVQLHETGDELDLRFQKYLLASASQAPKQTAGKKEATPSPAPRADLPVDADQQRAPSSVALGRPIELKKVQRVVPREVVRAPAAPVASENVAQHELVSSDLAPAAVAEPARSRAGENERTDPKQAASSPPLELDVADLAVAERGAVASPADANATRAAQAVPTAATDDSFSFGAKFSLDDLPPEDLLPEVALDSGRGAAQASAAARETRAQPPEDALRTAPPAVAESAVQASDTEIGDLEISESAREAACETSEDRRVAPRAPAHLAGQVESASGAQTILSQNISHSGVLVSVEGEAIPVGESVSLVLNHPVTGDELALAGSVARHQERDGSVVALAIRFEIPEARRTAVARFIDDVKAAEHAQSLAGIHGLIAEMGAPKILQMFAMTVSEGTLRFKRSDEEGTIVFCAGMLRWASAGPVSGRKAFWRLMSWDSGQFEFRGQVIETPDADEAPLMLQDAILQGVTQIADLKHLDLAELPAAAKLSLKKKFPKHLTSLESAIVELVRSNFTVRRILDVIPDPDLEIYRALLSLKERDVIHVLQMS